METCEKIGRLMEEKKLWFSQLAYLLSVRTGRGYDYKNIQKIIAGERKLNDNELQMLSEILGVTKEYLLDDRKSWPPSSEDRLKEATQDLKMEIVAVSLEEKTKWLTDELKKFELPSAIGKIPVRGYVSAGETNIAYGDAGLPVGESLPGEEPINRPFDVTDPNAYGLIVKGDSMLPGYPEGTKVVVCPSLEAKTHDIAIVRVKSTEKVYIKEVTFKRDSMSLISYNTIYYPTMEIPLLEVHFCHPVKWFKRP